MPAIIRINPPYAGAGTAISGPATTAQAFAFNAELANRNGRLRLISGLIVWDATNADSAALIHHAQCSMTVMPNGTTPIEITGIYRPSATTWLGSIYDETGWSAVDLRWSLLPAAWIDVGAGPVRLTQVTPTHWRQYLDINFRTHSWGPINWPIAGNLASAIWTYNGPLPGGDDQEDRPRMVPFDLYVGVEAGHWVTADDVSVASVGFASFQLDRVLIQMS